VLATVSGFTQTGNNPGTAAQEAVSFVTQLASARRDRVLLACHSRAWATPLPARGPDAVRAYHPDA